MMFVTLCLLVEGIFLLRGLGFVEVSAPPRRGGFRPNSDVRPHGA
jgi:hypothetical protein